MKRLRLLLCVPLFLLGCSDARPELHILNWGEYFAKDTLAQFEEETGCTVIYDKFDSPEALKAKLEQVPSGYDVVFPSDELVPGLAANGRLERLDLARLPNFTNIAPDFKGLAHDPKNEWSVPYMWGTTGIAYNKTRITPAPDSWSTLFDAAREERLSLLDDPREVFAAALRLEGANFAALTAADIDRAKARILAVKPKLLSGQPQDAMRHEDVWIAHMYSGDAAQVDGIGYVIPKEGGTLWFDNMCIAKGSKQVELAHRFIDFLMRPEIAAANTNAKRYPSPNEAARAFIAPEILANPIIYPPADALRRCSMLGALAPDHKRAIMDAWAEITAR